MARDLDLAEARDLELRAAHPAHEEDVEVGDVLDRRCVVLALAARGEPERGESDQQDAGPDEDRDQNVEDHPRATVASGPSYPTWRQGLPWQSVRSGLGSGGLGAPWKLKS